MKPAQTHIDLRIGELILRNVPYALRSKVAVAVEQELTRLLTERGLPPSLAQGGNIPHIGLDNLSLAPDMKADTIGSQIAQQIYHNLSGENSFGNTPV